MEYEDILDIAEKQVLTSDIYPNPVKDVLNVEAGSIDQVELYDIYGRRLCSKEKSDKVRIVMNNLSNGIYFIKIYSGGSSSVKKIVKK